MTFGELWLLIERNQISPDLRVVGYDGRFGLPADRVTIYDGEDAIINVPYGAVTVDKMVFKWDGNYTSSNNRVREVSMPAGTILKRLVTRKLIKSNKTIEDLIHKSLHLKKVVVCNEEDETIAYGHTMDELRRRMDRAVQRAHGLIPT